MCAACSWQSLKGVSGDIIVLEEAAYCDPGLISEVIVPLLSMQQSCLLCISTLLESGNHYVTPAARTSPPVALTRRCVAEPDV